MPNFDSDFGLFETENIESSYPITMILAVKKKCAKCFLNLSWCCQECCRSKTNGSVIK